MSKCLSISTSKLKFTRGLKAFIKVIIIFLVIIYSINIYAQQALKRIDLANCELDSFSLKTNGKTQYLYQSFYKKSPVGELYFINTSSGFLEKYNFNQNKHEVVFKLSNTLSLETQGLFVFNQDSLALLTDRGIMFYNSNGDKIGEHLFKSAMGTRWFDAGKSPLEFLENRFIFHMYGKRGECEFMFNLKNLKLEPIPIYYPSEYSRISGYVNSYSRTTYNEFVIMSFNVSPAIHFFNIRTNKTQSIVIKSSFDNGFVPIKEQERQALHNHSITSGFYHSIIYNPYNEKLYRVYFHPQPLKNEFGEYNDPFKNRKASILITDKTLKNTTEVVLNSDRFWVFFSLIPASKGVIIKGNQSLEEYEKKGLKYYYLKI